MPFPLGYRDSSATFDSYRGAFKVPAESETGSMIELRPTSDFKGPEVSTFETADETRNTARAWETGSRQRFPIVSAIALAIVLVLCGGILAVVCLTDRKDYDGWCSFTTWFRGKRAHAVITVNIWISIFTFISGKLLALAFVESLTINWWVGAMKGKTMKELNHDYEAGRSVGAVIKNLRLFNWLCVCSISYTLWGAMGPLLQRASTLKIDSSDWSPMTGYFNTDGNGVQALQANMSTNFGPISSAITDPSGFIFQDLTGPTLRLTELYAYSNLDLIMQVNGCPPIGTSRPSSQCLGWFETIGWDWDCGPNDFYVFANPKNETNEYFSVNFGYDSQGPNPYDIGVDIHYKRDSSCSGVILQRHCNLKPSIVKLPVAFAMINPNMSTESNDLIENWVLHIANKFEGFTTKKFVNESFFYPHGSSDAYEFATVTVAPLTTFWGSKTVFHDALQGRGDEFAWTDNVVRPAVPDEDPSMAEGTMGGLATLFNNLLSSSLTAVGKNVSTQTFESTGGMISAYAFDAGTNTEFLCNASYHDPTQEVINRVREITFRYSALYGMWHLRSFRDHAYHRSFFDLLNSTSIPGTGYYDMYRATRNVYHTQYLFVILAGVLMIGGIGCTGSLFYGYWKLGRKVSLSPMEMARAMNLPSGQNVNPMNPGEASNVRVDELIQYMGDMKVRYGEVGPNMLGLGLHERVRKPRSGEVYN